MLDNKNIILRSLEPEDLDFLFEIENDRRLWEISGTLSPFSRDLLKKYLEQSHQDIYQARQLRLVPCLKDTDERLGLIDLFDFDPQNLRAGIGIIIVDPHKNKGYASESLEIIIEYAFGQLKLHQLYANIPANNDKSKRLFEKSGFTLGSTRKDWIRSSDGFLDVHFYQIFNPDHHL